MGNLCQLISAIECTSSNNSSLFNSIFEKHVYAFGTCLAMVIIRIFMYILKYIFSYVLFNFIWKVSKSGIIFDSLLYIKEILKK